MQFKRAAGLYVAGICLFLGGPLLTYLATTFGPWAVATNPSAAAEVNGILIGVSVFGTLLGVIGFFMLVVAAHRALVKIDALPVAVPSSERENWDADR